MHFRCAKCGGSHGPANCPIPPKDREGDIVPQVDPETGKVVEVVVPPGKCAYCEVEGHTASSPKCPRREPILRAKVGRRDNARKKEGVSMRLRLVPGPFFQRRLEFLPLTVFTGLLLIRIVFPLLLRQTLLVLMVPVVVATEF